MRRGCFATAAALLLGLAGWPVDAAADGSRDVSLALVAMRFSQFDDTGVGLSASLSRRLVAGLSVEGQLGFSAADTGRPAFSASRIEAFLGFRAGVRAGRQRVFAAARPGFVRFAAAPEPFACILIFPPPLGCALAGGRTLFAVQLGAGVEAPLWGRSLVRLEVGSLLLRYPGPAIGKGRELFEESLSSHNPRAALSVGFRF